MSTQLIVEQHHQIRFANNVRMVAQQMGNPIRAAVTELPVSGEAARVADLLGKVEALTAEDRSRRNPENPVGRSARWLIRPEGMESGEYIDKEDKFTLAMDPSGQLVRAHTAAVRRAEMDRLLGVRPNGDGTFSVGYGGVMGKAVSGKRYDTVTDLPAGNHVVHNSTGLDIDKLRAARKALKKADFGIDMDLDPIYVAISPDQEDDLLGIAAATSTSLNAFQLEQLRSGKPTPLLGMNWIVTNRLPKVGTTRYCPMWTKSNVVAGWWQQIQGNMWNDTHAKNLPYIHVDVYVDAVRVEDGAVRIIECTEA